MAKIHVIGGVSDKDAPPAAPTAEPAPAATATKTHPKRTRKDDAT